MSVSMASTRGLFSAPNVLLMFPDSSADGRVDGLLSGTLSWFSFCDGWCCL